MRQEAVFLNGVYEDVLREILLIQEELPEHVMYLQPYSAEAIVHLREEPPTPEQPVRLYISVTDDLPTIKYTAEIVGWDDKTRMSKKQAQSAQPCRMDSPAERNRALRCLARRREAEHQPPPCPSDAETEEALQRVQTYQDE